jgi:hypothetical protein
LGLGGLIALVAHGALQLVRAVRNDSGADQSLLVPTLEIILGLGLPAAVVLLRRRRDLASWKYQRERSGAPPS